MNRIFSRVPAESIRRATEALRLTAEVRQEVRPRINRARALADAYEEMDEAMKNPSHS